MKKVLLAVALFALTAIPFVSGVQANDEVRRTPGTAAGKDGSASAMNRPMRKAMMGNPQHQLMMAYHKNVVIFGRALENVAKQGETVPPEFARTAVAEMRRSTEEMEKYRAGALASMPEMQRGNMQKMMDEHLVNVKTHLRQLEDLSKGDRIPSQEVLTHLQAILKGSGGMMHGRGPGGMGMRGGCAGCYGSGCPQCGSGQGMMMPQHRQMMQQMTQKLKAQDADLIQRVEKMKRAPKDKKLDQLADIVTTMVQQRAAMTSQMEKMQRQTLKEAPAAATAPVTMPSAGACTEDEDNACDDAGDMDMGGMKMDE